MTYINANAVIKITNKISDILVSSILNLIISQFQTVGAGGGGGLGHGQFEREHSPFGYGQLGRLGLCRKQKNKTNNKLGFNIRSQIFR